MADEMIWIASTLPTQDDGGDKVVLFEQDRAHPDGEAFVAGPKPVQVARTAGVERVLREGTAVVVDSGKSTKSKSAGTSGTGAEGTTGSQS